MKQSKTMQVVMIRARNEALRAKAGAPYIEHIYLAMLRISQSSSEKIAPSSSEREAIDAEIAEMRTIFEAAGVDAQAAETLLRPFARPGDQKSDAARQQEAMDLLENAEKAADGELTAPIVLKAILDQPSGIIAMANGGKDMPRDIGGAGDDLEDNDETAPAPMSPPRQEQGREEFSIGADSNSVRGGGSETKHTDRSDGSSRSEASRHGGFVMPEMPDASEFNTSALTIFDVSDERDSEPKMDPYERPKPGLAGEKKKPDDLIETPPAGTPQSDAETGPDGETEPSKDKPKPPKDKPKPKGGGVDLGAILMDLQKRRESGGTASEEPEHDEEPKEEETQENEPAPTPEPIKPKSEPPKKKPGDGIDLVAIMRELRERRESGENDGGDGEPEEKPDPKKPGPQPKTTPEVSAVPGKTKPASAPAQITRVPPKPTVKSEPPRPTVKSEPPRPTVKSEPQTGDFPLKKPSSETQKKTTSFLGSDYSGGLAYAIIVYALSVLVTVGLFWGLYLLLKRFYHPANMDAGTYEWLFTVVYVTGGYFLLRIIPGLFARRYEPFALFLDGLIFSAYVVFMAQTLLTTVEIQTAHGDVYIKIAAGIFVLGGLIRANGKIRMLPDTRGITKEAQYWVSKLTGSPDKIFYSGALITLFVPVVIGTVYWILNRPPHKSVLIYLFAAGWFLLVFLPMSQSLWYSEYEQGNNAKQKKRKAACEGWMMQAILLFPIALLFFLSHLYGWFPLPAWEIVLMSIFGLTYVIGTISTIANSKQ